MWVPPYVFWGVWAALLAGLIMLSSFLEQKAAMRGTNRAPLPSWVDKAIRLFFLVLLMWPFVAVLSLYVTLGLFVVYAPFFLDGSEKRGRASSLIHVLPVWQWVADYFAIAYESEGGYALEPGKAYVIGVHPHGLLPVASMVNVLSHVAKMHNEFFKATKVRALAASFCFYVPIYRDFLVGGGVIDAARYNARRALDDGYSLALVPGGATEALYASPGRHAVYIRSRRGFVKLAIETGASLVPCYSFGECELYGQLSASWPSLQAAQKKFQKVFGISLPLVTNIWPRKARVVTVAATAIPCAKNPAPTDAEVDAKLAEYIASLERVFYKYAPKYIEKPEQRKLEIF